MSAQDNFIGFLRSPTTPTEGESKFKKHKGDFCWIKRDKSPPLIICPEIEAFYIHEML